MARGALGDNVVDHYLNYARTEQATSTSTSPTGSAGATSSASSGRGSSRIRRVSEFATARGQWDKGTGAAGATPVTSTTVWLVHDQDIGVRFARDLPHRRCR